MAIYTWVLRGWPHSCSLRAGRQFEAGLATPPSVAFQFVQGKSEFNSPFGVHVEDVCNFRPIRCHRRTMPCSMLKWSCQASVLGSKSRVSWEVAGSIPARLVPLGRLQWRQASARFCGSSPPPGPGHDMLNLEKFAVVLLWIGSTRTVARPGYERR